MKKLLFILLFMMFFAQTSFGAKDDNAFVQHDMYKMVTEQANVYYAQNDIKSAFDMLISIPEEDRSAQNWLLIGNILQDQGKTDESRFMYNRAIQTDEKYYKAYYNLGNAYMSEGRTNLAIEQYKKVIKLKPEYAYGHYNLGCAYMQLGQYRKAKYELLLATDYKNNVADFHYNLALCYKKLNNEKMAKTYLEYYNKLIESQM